jgi:Fic family protein
MEKYKSGNWKQQFKYKSFDPSLINQTLNILEPRVVIALEEANRLIGELNAYSKIIPDVDFFIRMHVTKEATESSRIEGTKTELDEALMDEDEIDPEKRDDWKEVNNYIKAMNYSIQGLRDVPLSTRLLKDTHRILLSNSRGQNKQPGEIRNSQNWIGGSNLTNAFFIPPHQDQVQDLLSDLEKFWHNDDIQVPELLKAAISHYQFETIHPFLDGNGRIGRLLITLYLIDKKLLEKPVLYLSNFFSRHKNAYYDSLTIVRRDSNLTQWLLFFLDGVIVTAKESRETFEKIIDLREECNFKIMGLGKKAPKAQKLLQDMYSRPIMDINEMSLVLQMSHQASSSMARNLEELELLREVTGYKRNKLYVFEPYMAIFSRR